MSNNRKEMLKRLKEAGRLKEYAYKLANNKLKEGNFEDQYRKNAEDLYNVDDIIAGLSSDRATKAHGGFDRKDREADIPAPKLEPDVFSAHGDDYEDETTINNAGYEDTVYDYDRMFADEPRPEERYVKPEPQSTVNLRGPRGRREVSPDEFKTMEELDSVEREDLKARRDSMREGRYIIYDKNQNQTIPVEAANLEDAAIQAADLLGDEWGMITDENGSESISNMPGDEDMDNEMDREDYMQEEDDNEDEEELGYFSDLGLDDIPEPTDDDLNAIDDKDMDYTWSPEEEYGEDEEEPEDDLYTKDPWDDDYLYENQVEAFDDGIFHKRLREKEYFKEHKTKKTLDDWNGFWSTRNGSK